MADLTLEQVLERVLHPRFGILKSLTESNMAPGEPDLMIMMAEYQDTMVVNRGAEGFRPDRAFKLSMGAGLDRHSVIWATVGEGIERYAAEIFDEDSIIYATEAAVREQGRVVTPDDFILYSNEQYEDPNHSYTKYNPDKVIGWVKGADLITKEEVILPASLTIMGYSSQSDDENFCRSYSTGCATGPNAEWAVCNGLLESVERDCYGLHWAARHAPPKIDMETAMANVRPSVQKLLMHPGIGYEIMDLTTELGVPCIMVYSRHIDRPGVALGCCANLDPRKALEKAVIESNHTLNWTVDLRRWGIEINETEVEQFHDNVKYYLNPDVLHKFSWVYSSEERSTLFDDLPADALNGAGFKEQIRILLDKLKAHGHSAYVVDITPSDIDSLGLNVLRVVAPSLQPMWTGYGNVYNDRRRYEAFLKHIGAELDRPINGDLHPFP